MPRYGISVEKTINFRGVQQPFANVYYYEAPTIALTANTDQEALLDQVVAAEKTFHATLVSFVRGRVWNTGSGSQAGNQMRVDKALTGTGAATAQANVDRERAVLVQVQAGTNSRGKPVYLRKWYHTASGAGGGAFAQGVLENSAAMTAAQRDYWAARLSDLMTLELLGNPVATLTSQTGRQVTGAAECHPYLEHHQLGDQWRG